METKYDEGVGTDSREMKEEEAPLEIKDNDGKVVISVQSNDIDLLKSTLKEKLATADGIQNMILDLDVIGFVTGIRDGHIRNCRIKGGNLYTNSILTYGVNFHNCIFDKYGSVNSRYIYTNFFDCTFLGCDFVYSEFDSCSFNHCDIRKSRLSYSDFHESYIYKSYMAGVDLSYSDIDEVYISNTEIDSSSIIPMIDETDFRKDVVGWAFGLTDVGVPVICKLLVPGDAQKSISYKHAYRCSKARVLEVQRMDGTDSHLSARFVSEHGSIQRFVGNICFSNGEMMVSGAWGENAKYCTDGGGIKFYLSRDYAVRAARRYVDIRGDVAGFDGDGNRLPPKEGNEENEE